MKEKIDKEKPYSIEIDFVGAGVTSKVVAEVRNWGWRYIITTHPGDEYGELVFDSDDGKCISHKDGCLGFYYKIPKQLLKKLQGKIRKIWGWDKPQKAPHE